MTLEKLKSFKKVIIPVNPTNKDFNCHRFKGRKLFLSWIPLSPARQKIFEYPALSIHFWRGSLKRKISRYYVIKLKLCRMTVNNPFNLLLVMKKEYIFFIKELMLFSTKIKLKLLRFTTISLEKSVSGILNQDFMSNL